MGTSLPFLLHLLTILLLLSVPILVCNGADIINTTDTFGDADRLISSGGNFELGFFSPGKSPNRYLGIWYRKITVLTVIWVANRDTPIANASGSVLKLVQPGILILQNSSNSVVWSSNSTTPSRVARFPVAQLLDTGNLVVKEANDDNPENYLWQSFDYPTDTLMAGMKLGHFGNGHENYLSSWKSSDDPGTGPYTYHLDPTGYPQAILRKDSVEVYRTGPWNGNGYSGLPRLQNNSIYTYNMVINGSTVYYEYQKRDESVITRFMMNATGITQRWAWLDRTRGWTLYLTAPTDSCDTYNQCGAYASCDLANTPICGCLGKFAPKDPEAWGRVDYSNGCVRRTPLDCGTDGFVKYSEVKLPDARSAMWVNRSMTLSECQMMCQRDCSCMAYATVEVRDDGNRCLRWFGDLLDIKQVSGAGQDIFIRMASSELESGKKKGKILIASLTSVGGVIVVLGSIVLYCICKRRNYLKLRKGAVENQRHKDDNNDMELPWFDLDKVYKATKSFSLSNKIGEGGFGPVYKGTLEDGQEIAVKRLSQTSFQGLDECKNEVICIARLQHRNLVKLLGCCIRGEENMLVYEYMPNKSLDLILFDEKKSSLLDWPMRFHIITGIARGLLYLHQDSRLTVIHRDLKVSNILLDADMNPKISDFGMARIFDRNETQANTKRIVGTYGYMSPEYASMGLFSMKSDVFSFGVIMLEIISGQRNRVFAHEDHPHNLLGHAWMLHRDGKSLELVHDKIMESCPIHEVLRTIHVGLLCVQAYPDDRPSMSLVVKMLENDMELPPARQPGFYVELGDKNSVHDFSGNTKSFLKNEISVTMLEPR